MDNERYKKMRATINNRQAADERRRAELQGMATQPAQPVQRAQSIKAPSEQDGVQQAAQAPKAQQTAAPQNTGPAFQTYEQQSAAAPQATPAAPQGQTAPGAGSGYVSPYQQQIDDLYQQITGRKPFSYDIDEDAMWQSLKDDYQRMGKKAMRDTMGRAAGLTGGYGSSYSQAAGQAAYDEYLTQLSERAPELYDRALSLYQKEGADMLDRLGVLMQRDSDEYNRYRQERAYADERADLDYQRQQQEREYNDSRADKEYQRQQEERSYIMSLIQYGYNPTDEDLAAAGMSREEAEQIAAVWRAGNPDMAYRLGLISADDYYRMTGQYPAGYTPPESQTPVYTGTGSGYNGSSNGQGLSDEEFKRLMSGVGSSRSDAEKDATIKRLKDSGVYDKLSPEQQKQLEGIKGPSSGTNGSGGQGYNYGSGIPAQQFFSIESAISKAGSPEAAQQLFNEISDSTFSNMSQEQINRLSAALRKAGA